LLALDLRHTGRLPGGARRIRGCPGTVHGWPAPAKPSSTSPSQSSSSPLHTSVCGVAVWMHSIAPEAQFVVPSLQIPGLPVRHAWFAPGLPSSLTPSQSSSTPLQVSVAGNTV
jgi:hypothetical protein